MGETGSERQAARAMAQQAPGGEPGGSGCNTAHPQRLGKGHIPISEKEALLVSAF